MDRLSTPTEQLQPHEREQRVPSPAGWDRVRCGYVLLSDAYRDAAAEARERGWRVEEIAGAKHLHIAVAPDVVTDTLIRLVANE